MDLHHPTSSGLKIYALDSLFIALPSIGTTTMGFFPTSTALFEVSVQQVWPWLQPREIEYSVDNE